MLDHIDHRNLIKKLVSENSQEYEFYKSKYSASDKKPATKYDIFLNPIPTSLWLFLSNQEDYYLISRDDSEDYIITATWNGCEDSMFEIVVKSKEYSTPRAVYTKPTYIEALRTYEMMSFINDQMQMEEFIYRRVNL